MRWNFIERLGLKRHEMEMKTNRRNNQWKSSKTIQEAE